MEKALLIKKSVQQHNKLLSRHQRNDEALKTSSGFEVVET